MIKPETFLRLFKNSNLLPTENTVSDMRSTVHPIFILNGPANNFPVLIGVPVTVSSYAPLSRSSVPPCSAGILRQGESLPESERTGHRSSRR